MTRILILVSALLAIPLFGIVSGSQLNLKLNDIFASQLYSEQASSGRIATVSSVCQEADVRSRIAAACEYSDDFKLLVTASIVCAGIAVALLALIELAVFIAGQSHRLLSLVFGLGRRWLLIILGLLVWAQAIVAACSFYLLETVFFHSFHPYFSGAAAIGGLVGGAKILISSFTVGQRSPISALAIKVTEETQGRLCALVDSVSESIGTRPPANIILSFDSNFYATEADVMIVNNSTTISGNTLSVSLPFLRILDNSELTAVVAHELGHFSGNDTYHAMRFTSDYADLKKTLATISLHRGVFAVALKAGTALLQFYLERFSTIERSIRRQREIAADQAGQRVAGGDILALALMKVALLAPAWEVERKDMIEALRHNKVLINGSAYFEAVSRKRLELLDRDEALSDLVSEPLAASATHPNLMVRMRALEVDPKRVAHDVAMPHEPALSMVDNAESIEKELTGWQAQLFAKAGPSMVATPS